VKGSDAPSPLLDEVSDALRERSLIVPSHMKLGFRVQGCGHLGCGCRPITLHISSPWRDFGAVGCWLPRRFTEELGHKGTGESPAETFFEIVVLFRFDDLRFFRFTIYDLRMSPLVPWLPLSVIHEAADLE